MDLEIRWFRKKVWISENQGYAFEAPVLQVRDNINGGGWQDVEEVDEE